MVTGILDLFSYGIVGHLNIWKLWCLWWNNHMGLWWNWWAFCDEFASAFCDEFASDELKPRGPIKRRLVGEPNRATRCNKIAPRGPATSAATVTATLATTWTSHVSGHVRRHVSCHAIRHVDKPRQPPRGPVTSAATSAATLAYSRCRLFMTKNSPIHDKNWSS